MKRYILCSGYWEGCGYRCRTTKMVRELATETYNIISFRIIKM